MEYTDADQEVEKKEEVPPLVIYANVENHNKTFQELEYKINRKSCFEMQEKSHNYLHQKHVRL